MSFKLHVKLITNVFTILNYEISTQFPVADVIGTTFVHQLSLEILFKVIEHN